MLAQIHNRLEREGLLPSETEAAGYTTGAELTTLDARAPNKRKRTNGPAYLQYYSANCDTTHVHDKRQGFQACRHLGNCTDTCPCVKQRVTCEKSCTCSATCPRRWQGCKCRQQEKPCTGESCLCISANRECDPDLCGGCGAAEALDPATRYNEQVISKRCQNVALQRDMPVRTLLGRSSVAGFGLFVGEPVRAKGFLGEYKGELITSEEAERRGKLYDKRGVSFLFNLNETQVIDATRAGNKFRFVNHSRNPNIGARIYFAGCVHRITMFATRNIQAGEELFFNYGSKYSTLGRAFDSWDESGEIDASNSYNNKQVKFVQKEAQDVAAPPLRPGLSPASRSASEQPDGRTQPTRGRPKNKRKKDALYLRGGHGTTERTMKLKTRQLPGPKNAPQNSPPPVSKTTTHATDRSRPSSQGSHPTARKTVGLGSSSSGRTLEGFVVEDEPSVPDPEDENDKYRPEEDTTTEESLESDSTVTDVVPESEVEEPVVKKKKPPTGRPRGRPPNVRRFPVVPAGRRRFTTKTAGVD